MARLSLAMVIGIVLMYGTQGKDIVLRIKVDSDNKCGKDSLGGSKGHINGAVYVRWGHDTCPPNDSKLVYSGAVGGSIQDRGSGTNYLCLAKNSTHSKTNEFFHHGDVYGVRYRLIKIKTRRVRKQDDYLVPCAVCQSLLRTNTFMLPGRDVCPKEWHREYKGILMGQRNALIRKRTQYTCVDASMKTIKGTKGSRPAGRLYPVVAKCGGIQCPPYTEGQTMPCAVCSN